MNLSLRHHSTLASIALCAALCACMQSPAEPQAQASPTQATQAPTKKPTPQKLPKHTTPKPSNTTKTPDKAPPLRFLQVLTGGAQDSDALPLIVAAHGLGSRPESFQRVYKSAPFRARVIVPYAPTPYSRGFSWFPLSRPLHAPGKHTTNAMRTSAQKIADLIQYVRERKPTQGPTIVTGFSQGGLMSYMVAVHHPNTVDAAVPIAGWLPDELQLKTPTPNTTYPTIRAFHGEADSLIPLPPTQTMVDALSKHNINASIQTYEGVVHNIPGPMRSDILKTLQTLLDTKPTP